MTKYLMVDIPEDIVEAIIQGCAKDAEIIPMSMIYPLIAKAQEREAERKELDKYSKPMAPPDVPDEVWQAVANQYHEAQWTPAPNHHPEYRDTRAAFRATVKLIAKRLWDWDRQAAKFVQDILAERDRGQS